MDWLGLLVKRLVVNFFLHFSFSARLSTGLDGASISIFRVIALTEIILFPIIIVARIG